MSLSKHEELEKPPQKLRGRIRNAADLAGGLAVEFEIELRLRRAIVLPAPGLELIAPETTPGQRGAPDFDAHPRSPPRNAARLGVRGDSGDNAPRDQARAARCFGRKDENLVAFPDPLAAIHRPRLRKRERAGSGVGDGRFDEEGHRRHLAHPNVQRRRLKGF